MKKTLGQIAMHVTHLDVMEDFYKNTVGLTHLFTVPNRLSFFDLGGVRLMLGIAEPGEYALSRPILYYKTSHLDEEFARLKSVGVVVVHQPQLVAPMPDHDLWMAFFKDPEDNTLGIMEERSKNK
ncbi:MAG TPA: VOC family protein [bacterium]|nr:VOC family protein [bacterium]HNB58272.1 VOC family protein [bacterium]HNC47686.1 VOC family protein [bacterium]HND76528.1 VOC family protein [bacterium]HNE83621.1 VOC family protein [bacterium]